MISFMLRIDPYFGTKSVDPYYNIFFVFTFLYTSLNDFVYICVESMFFDSSTFIKLLNYKKWIKPPVLD